MVTDEEPRLPTPDEINPFDDLDGRAALEAFLGKSLAEAEAMFREEPLSKLEDLAWMGSRAFDFYAPAAIRAVIDDPDGIDLDSVRALLTAIESRLGPDNGHGPPPDSIRLLVSSTFRDLAERFDSLEPSKQDRSLLPRIRRVADTIA